MKIVHTKHELIIKNKLCVTVFVDFVKKKLQKLSKYLNCLIYLYLLARNFFCVKFRTIE